VEKSLGYENREWHRLEADTVIKLLGSSQLGLSSEEAKKRLVTFGYNKLEEAKKLSPLEIFVNQFKNVLMMILIAAVVISAFIGELLDSVVILVILFFAAVLGFVQEYKAEKTIETLRKLTTPTVSVLRDGSEQEIPIEEVVPGDMLIIKTGDKIPADCRIVESINLKTDESVLTGESIPVEKHVDPIKDPRTTIPDRKNMLYAGTIVTYGRGKAVVVATGMRTEFGKIAGMLQEMETRKTPLQENLDKLGATLAKIAIVVVAMITLPNILRGEPVLEMFIWGVALAVAVVPEALPAVVTISLAIGMRRMAKRKALIRRLPAVETLGCTSIICSDKTGTLTKGEMTVKKIFVNNMMVDVTGTGYKPEGEFFYDQKKLASDDKHLRKLLLAGMLCNDATLRETDGNWVVGGDPTEGALVVAAHKAGLTTEHREKLPRVGEIPFTPERKRMTTIHKTDQGLVVYSKGAPETILGLCTRILLDGREEKLDKDREEQILKIARDMAGNALRVLGLAYKTLESFHHDREVEKDLVFLGLVGMIDPPREETKNAIIKCETAGIKPVMITGDHKLTAVAIAKQLGILKSGIALTGTELEDMDEEEFRRIVEKVEVYARVSPSHKIRVVDALAEKGHVVAMTGDGVNDAPALKKADVGVAMGITGTDVAKEASDMVLTDDNFASIVAAVEEGRAIFGNIKKYLMYLLSSNLGEILVMVAAVALGLPLPLVAIQILWVNLATDGLPALALALDPPEPDIMQQPPRDPKKTIFTKPVVGLTIVGGVWSMIVNISLFMWALNSGRGILEARTIVFVSLVLIQFFKAFNYRSDRHSITKIGLHTNKWLLLAIAWESLLLTLIINLEPLQGPFQTFSLTPLDWLTVLGAATTIFPILELAKIPIRRSQFHTTTKPLTNHTGEPRR